MSLFSSGVISHESVIPTIAALPLMPRGVNDEGSGLSLLQLMLRFSSLCDMLRGESRCDCQEDEALPSPTVIHSWFVDRWVNDLSSSGSAIKVTVLKSCELPFSDNRMPCSALRMPARKLSPYGPPLC